MLTRIHQDRSHSQSTNSPSSLLASWQTGRSSPFSPRPARLGWRSVCDRTDLEQEEPFSPARSYRTGKSSGRVKRESKKPSAELRGNIVERVCHLMHTCTTKQLSLLSTCYLADWSRLSYSRLDLHDWAGVLSATELRPRRGPHRCRPGQKTVAKKADSQQLPPAPSRGVAAEPRAIPGGEGTGLVRTT